jgi:hypothetical protein
MMPARIPSATASRMPEPQMPMPWVDLSAFILAADLLHPGDKPVIQEDLGADPGLEPGV